MDNNNPENLAISEKMVFQDCQDFQLSNLSPSQQNQPKLKRHPALQHHYSSTLSSSGMETKKILRLFQIVYTYRCKCVCYQLRTFKYILK